MSTLPAADRRPCSCGWLASHAASRRLAVSWGLAALDASHATDARHATAEFKLNRPRAHFCRLGLFVSFLFCIVSADNACAASFGEDVAFLQEHIGDVLVLERNASAAKVAIVPSLQGRVMTSSLDGDDGMSFGWINRALIRSGKLQKHINAYGGEDRFWLGPEGGQFSIFFPPGAAFDLNNWQTPPPIDTEPYELVRQTGDTAHFRHEMTLGNYSRATFDLRVDREVRLLSRAELQRVLGAASLAGTRGVAFESVNRITNTGQRTWRKETGLLSIWILGMFNPSPATTVVVPIRAGADSELGPRVNADYFGSIPKSRLRADENVVFFAGDGKFRGKIGVGPRRCRPLLGSYDAERKVLTIVQFTLPHGATNYVNSAWEIQDHPYDGDVANSYNDGSPAPGAKPLGPFYELESSSPAAALASGQSMKHIHRTVHLMGSAEQLNRISAATLGVTLEQISAALPPGR